MASDLIVGRIDEFDAPAVDDILAAIGVAGHGWNDCADEIAVISALNVAALDHFNHYAAGLEGLRGPTAMMRTQFRHLPWWLATVWLPIAPFDPPHDLAARTGDAMFVGSCQRLLAELDEIKRRADIDLGSVPRAYELMRKDYRAWEKGLMDRPGDDDGRLSHEDTIRWLWRALHDGAQLAVKHRAPLSMLG